MSVFGTDSQLKGRTSRNLDETLPSNDDIPQDVYDLQDEYERKLQEEEASDNDEVIKSKPADHRKDRRTSRSRRGCSNRSTTKEGPITCEETVKTINKTKRASNGCKTLYDTEQTFLLAANEGHSDDKSDVINERKILSSSLPSALVKKQKSKTDGKERRLRRTSDPIQEVSKNKCEYTCYEENTRTLNLEREKRRSRNREKREKKGEGYTKTTSLDLDKTSVRVFEKSHEEKNGHTGKNPVREGTVDAIFQPGDYKTIDGKKLSNTSRRSKTFHKSYTSPSKLSPKNFSVEGRSSDCVTHDNVVASEAYESECFKCNAREKHVPASCYCLQCECYLCQNCLRRHDELTKLHDVWKGDEMPGSFTIKQIIEKCAKHPNENITCFCKKHICLCCNECNKTDHSNCTKQPLENMLIQIPDALKLRKNISKACKQKLTSLQKIYIELKSGQDIQANMKYQAIEDIEKKSSVMIDHIKKLEKDSIKQVKEYFNEEKVNNAKVISDCEQNIRRMCKNIRYLDEPKGNTESAIRTVEKIKQIEIQCLMKQTYETEELFSVKTCKFTVNENLYKTVTEATSLGELSGKVPLGQKKTNLSMEQSLLCDADETVKLIDTDLENSSCIDEENPVSELLGKSLSKLKRIPIWVEGDLRSQTCCTAIEVLDDGTVLVADSDNMKLKWFDSIFSLKKAFKLSSEPWGITRIIGNKYLVTLPMESSYQELEVFEGDISFRRKVELDIECICAVQVKDKLLFAGIYETKPNFLLTKLDGTKIEFIFSEKKFDLFGKPNHLLKSPLNPDFVFVSDAYKGVFGIDMAQRKIKFHYTGDLLCAMGMTITDSGLLYICSQQTHTLHCISHEGQFLYSVTLQDDKTLITPQCICYIRGLDEFLIVHDNSYSIFKFKLEMRCENDINVPTQLQSQQNK